MGLVYLTPFGKELRKLRIDKDEVLQDMADKLELTPAYLSAIETGKRDIPKDFKNKVAEIYSLSPEEINKLDLACIETRNRFEVTFPEQCKEKSCFVETAQLFAKNFSRLNDSQLENLRNILLSVDKE